MVKSSVSELPRLPEWRSDTAPLDLTDWFLTIEPALGDLSDGSQQWWEGMLEAARKWYAEHLEKTPLERVNHVPEVPDHLRGPRYQRLEKRATALLMAAISQSQQEEVVAGKDVSAMNILGRLMLSYQPGGLSEKAAILTALDSPEEAATLASAVGGLRRWLRWHRRAGEVGVVRPDATLQVKGLGRLMKRVLRDNSDLAFRIQLAKSSLQIDTTPTEKSVMTFAHHLLAEVEQIAHQDKKKREERPPLVTEQRLKKMEESKGEGKGGKGEKGSPCRFFLSPEGCKKGKLCTWVHQLDDQRRCWTCGSTEHFAPECPRPKDASEAPREKGSGKSWEGKGSRPATRTMRKEETIKEEGQASDGGAVEEQASRQADTMKSLLEEANRMLKGMSVRQHEVTQGAQKDRLQAMQDQLDELRRMKVLKLSRLTTSKEKFGLLDSGATHPMRPRRKGEDLSRYEKVNVTLANGEQIKMHMTGSQVMVAEAVDVEPILPMSSLTDRLGYALTWKGGELEITHPEKGPLTVKMENGCPLVQKKVALRLIDELEMERGARRAQVMKSEEEQWLWDLVEAHPVLRTLPMEVKRMLVLRPAEDLGRLPGCNRRRRRVMEREGFVAHLYAGKDEGYTLGRAFREIGGDKRRLVEIDIERECEEGRSHDMLAEHGPYASLLRGALSGTLKGIVMGPNCRTRSVLRHYPLDVPGGGPRPVRSWEEPWGMKRNTVEEQRKVHEDDVLMWRGWMLFILSEEIRRATNETEEKMWIGLEQPADPTHYMPETVTFWKTSEWRRLKERYQLMEQTFSQASWGGRATKPTTFAGNMILELPEESVPSSLSLRAEDWREVSSSKELSRWAPGFMREVASKIQKLIFRKKIRASRMCWEEHVQRGHTPFRRDCQVCQEASARGRPHFAAGCARAGVLNLDVAGPFIGGKDVEETQKMKFMLVGTYTWLLPEKDEAEDREVPLGPEDEEAQGPELDDPEEHGGRADYGEDQEDQEDEMEPEDRHEPDRGDDQVGEDERVEERREPRVEVLKLGIPLRGKSKEDVMAGIIELYLQLRVDGYPVHTIHTDRGREFTNAKLTAWMRSRTILHSTNGGEDPQANGRVEQAVGEVKRHLRRLLHSAGLDASWWPMALRYAMETARMRRRGYQKKVPGFGQTVLVKKRSWRTKVLEATHEAATYLTPLVECHGHCILRENGRWNVAPYVVQNVRHPPPPSEEMWLAVTEDLDRDEVEERRRIRGKQPIRDGDGMKLRAIRLMIQEESAGVEGDDFEVAMTVFKKLDPWKQTIRKAEAEEEILQTKVVGVQEMLKELPLWDPAIRSEMDSLFVQKEALRVVPREEVEDIRKRYPELNSLPAKLVITRKAGGKRKIRIVVCGNYAEKNPEDEFYAGGSDSISLRAALKKATQEGWLGVTADVRTAFLNAPLPGYGEEDGTLVMINPPRLLVKLGYVEPTVQWMAIKAMYGLRQSPKTRGTSEMPHWPRWNGKWTGRSFLWSR